MSRIWPRIIFYFLVIFVSATVTLPASAGINIAFELEDPYKFKSVLGNNFAVFVDNLSVAKKKIFEVLSGKGTIDVLVKIDDTFTTASADVEEWVDSALAFGIMHCGPFFEARTGTDPNGTKPDITIRLPTKFLTDDVWFDPSGDKRDANIPADKLDFITVVLHEMLHGLGFNGFRRDLPPTKVGIFPEGKKSTFDHFTDWGKPGLGGIPADKLGFYGPHAVHQHGGPIELTGGEGGYYHLGNPKGADTLADDLMSGANLSVLGLRKSISLLDLAIMRDLGWQPIYQMKKSTSDTADFDQLKPITHSNENGHLKVDPDKLKKKPNDKDDN